VVPGQNGALQVRNHGLVVAENTGKHFFFQPEFANQVFPQLGFHGAGLVARLFQLAKGGDGFVLHRVYGWERGFPATLTGKGRWRFSRRSQERPEQANRPGVRAALPERAGRRATPNDRSGRYGLGHGYE